MSVYMCLIFLIFRCAFVLVKNLKDEAVVRKGLKTAET